MCVGEGGGGGWTGNDILTICLSSCWEFASPKPNKGRAEIMQLSLISFDSTEIGSSTRPAWDYIFTLEKVPSQ